MSTFALKLIALILMFLDHVGYYFEGAPIWLRWLGRSSYPLFLFCMVWGYQFTRNRRVYLLRLYLCGVFMTAFGYCVDRFFSSGEGYGNHNIFVPLLLVGVCISTIELFQRDVKRGGLALGAIFGVQILYYMLPGFIPFLKSLDGDLLTGLIPNLFHNEYGYEFVALGVLMYFLKDKKELFTVVYLLFCINQFSGEMFTGGANQWLMVLALPLMLRYNRQKGPGMKYFFYVFYPVHSFLLFYLANFVFNKG